MTETPKAITPPLWLARLWRKDTDIAAINRHGTSALIKSASMNFNADGDSEALCKFLCDSYNGPVEHTAQEPPHNFDGAIDLSHTLMEDHLGTYHRIILFRNVSGERMHCAFECKTGSFRSHPGAPYENYIDILLTCRIEPVLIDVLYEGHDQTPDLCLRIPAEHEPVQPIRIALR